jgi:hypothetical protein
VALIPRFRAEGQQGEHHPRRRARRGSTWLARAGSQSIGPRHVCAIMRTVAPWRQFRPSGPRGSLMPLSNDDALNPKSKPYTLSLKT